MDATRTKQMSLDLFQDEIYTVSTRGLNHMDALLTTCPSRVICRPLGPGPAPFQPLPLAESTQYEDMKRPLPEGGNSNPRAEEETLRHY